MAAVEAFGLLVKLGEGVRALVPKNHLGDVAVKNPKARFKVSLLWYAMDLARQKVSRFRFRFRGVLLLQPRMMLYYCFCYTYPRPSG